MSKNHTDIVILSVLSSLNKLFTKFHKLCEEDKISTTDRHYILNRAGIDPDEYEEWLDSQADSSVESQTCST